MKKIGILILLTLISCTYVQIRDNSYSPQLAPSKEVHDVLKRATDRVVKQMFQDIPSRIGTGPLYIVQVSYDSVSSQLLDYIMEKFVEAEIPTVRISYEKMKSLKPEEARFCLILYPMVYSGIHKNIVTTSTTRFFLSFLPIVGGLIARSLEYEEAEGTVVVHARLEDRVAGTLFERDYFAREIQKITK